MKITFERVKPIFILAIVGIAIAISLWIYSNAIQAYENENPFDYIRETEEQDIFNGTINHVEYINESYANDDYCILVLDGRLISFYKDAYGELKEHEGEQVSITAYVTGYDGLYRLYPCRNDFPMGGIR